MNIQKLKDNIELLKDRWTKADKKEQGRIELELLKLNLVLEDYLKNDKPTEPLKWEDGRPTDGRSNPSNGLNFI